MGLSHKKINYDSKKLSAVTKKVIREQSPKILPR